MFLFHDLPPVLPMLEARYRRIDYSMTQGV